MATADTGPYISKLGMKTQTYTIKDAYARAEIEDLWGAISGGVVFRGVLASGSLEDGETPLKDLTVVDGATTKTITAASQKDGNIFIYPKTVGSGTQNLEFIISNGHYEEIGSTGSLGTFAYANQGTGSVAIPISSAITFNPLTPDVSVGTLSITVEKASLSHSDTQATGKFSPAAISIGASEVTFTPSKSTFTAFADTTYDENTSTLTIATATSDAYWTSATGQAAGQTVTPQANQTINVTYSYADLSEDVLTGATLTGALGINAVTPTATITNPTVTVTVTPAST